MSCTSCHDDFCATILRMRFLALLTFVLGVGFSLQLVGQTLPTVEIRAAPGQTEFHGDGDHITYDGPLAGDAAGQLDIQLHFQEGLTPSQQAIFSTSEFFWESMLRGYQPGITLDSISITVSGEAIDGVGNVLGTAGPTTTTKQGGFTLSTGGTMRFDTADLDNLEEGGSLQDVILHEMVHVLGFGTLWDFGLNHVYSEGSGQYTGAAALAAYKTEFNQPDATFVPVELGGEEGTSDGHWDENEKGIGITGITDPSGRDLRNELMTGWLNEPTFVSEMTLQSFTDIGFAVIPEPSGMGLVLWGLISFLSMKRNVF